MHFSRARANKKIHFEHSSMVADVKGRGIKERKGNSSSQLVKIMLLITPDLL